MRKTACLLCLGALLCAAQPAAKDAVKHKVLFNRFRVPEFGLFIADADGKTVPLTDGSHYDNFPAWSPKGDVIIFTSDRAGDFQLFTVRPDGTGIRQLTDTPGINAHSVWSPDGEWVAFASGRMGF
jgi:Tol biopolymer transport system component